MYRRVELRKPKSIGQFANIDPTTLHRLIVFTRGRSRAADRESASYFANKITAARLAA